ncbi:hypothetical protein ES288_D11G350700v1 [Gossypium darwinii]|uniref:Uncharacterized protein n=1 Tax=Gossypium darwinii TaxID=34276 RepID=A0A5D2ART6_GOSDA|nr:hypothetical protein ES288_D11G350700v1 [Gossypium darwinii]
MAKLSFLSPFMFALLFSTFGVILSAKHSNITIDQSALLVLKSHITHDPHNLLSTNWSTSTSICNWLGVTCGSRHHRVTALNLSSMNLSGIIPSQLGNLSFLGWLDIRHNNFHGSLPIELAHLHRLKYLDFDNNNFDGEIPSWLGYFTKLQRLSLHGNNFDGVIPATLGSLSKLQRLRLESNQISELELLSLYNNSLEGSTPAEIGNLTLLNMLYLDGNHLKGEQFLNNRVRYLINLCLFVRDTNELKCWISVVTALVENPKLVYDCEIPPVIGNLTSLVNIDLSYNLLRGIILYF